MDLRLQLSMLTSLAMFLSFTLLLFPDCSTYLRMPSGGGKLEQAEWLTQPLPQGTLSISCWRASPQFCCSPQTALQGSTSIFMINKYMAGVRGQPLLIPSLPWSCFQILLRIVQNTDSQMWSVSLHPACVS